MYIGGWPTSLVTQIQEPIEKQNIVGDAILSKFYSKKNFTKLNKKYTRYFILFTPT